jgi:hypothetical protein
MDEVESSVCRCLGARLDEVGLNEVARGWVVGGREGFLVESILKNQWILILYNFINHLHPNFEMIS